MLHTEDNKDMSFSVKWPTLHLRAVVVIGHTSLTAEEYKPVTFTSHFHLRTGQNPLA